MIRRHAILTVVLSCLAGVTDGAQPPPSEPPIELVFVDDSFVGAAGKLTGVSYDGSRIESWHTNMQWVRAVAVDADRLYWFYGSFNRMSRGRLGSSEETILHDGFLSPHRIEADPTTGLLYWGNVLGIWSYQPGGPSPTRVLERDWGPAAPIALDLDGGHIYWTEADDDVVGRSRFDGSEAEILPIEMDNPYLIEVFEGWLYVGEYSRGEIVRVRPDGSSASVVVQLEPQHLTDIAIDRRRRVLYWSTGPLGGTIERTSVDGGPIETFLSGLAGARQLAIVPGRPDRPLPDERELFDPSF